MIYKGIGYIFNLLMVSPTKLSYYLNIDRTLISKWKNGTRKVDFQGTYFDKLLEYLLVTNESLGTEYLEQLFRNIYNAKDFSKESMKIYLKKFIVNNENCELHYNQNQPKEKENIYPVAIYHTEEDKIKSTEDFLNVALSLKKSCKITLIYTDGLDLSKTNSQLLENWYHKISLLLNRGFSIDLIISVYQSSSLFMFYCSRLFLNENCKVYLYMNSENRVGGFSLEIIENKRLKLGLTSTFTTYPIHYCSVFEDLVSIQAFNGFANKIKLGSCLLLTNYKQSEFLKRANYYEIYKPKKFEFFQPGAAYSVSPYPPYLFMNEELLVKVLRNSPHTEEEIQNELIEYRKCKEILIEEYKNNGLVSFFSLSHLMELASQDTIIYTKQNTILSPALTLTNAQYREHLKDVADFLLSHPDYNICLSDEAIIPSFAGMHCWCKKNQMMFLFDTDSPKNLVLSENNVLVNSVVSFLEQQFLSTPQNMKSRNIVANILKSI
ncbi:MAG: hypothetical protein ACK5MV_03440 [Aminipila sp.]